MCIIFCYLFLLLKSDFFFPQLFVRALFDYDPNVDPTVPCKDAAVAFKRGDILQIVSTEDDTWWQACHLRDGDARAGLIPSQQLHERWSFYAFESLTLKIKLCHIIPINDFNKLLFFLWFLTGELHCSDPRRCSSLVEKNHQVMSQSLSIKSPEKNKNVLTCSNKLKELLSSKLRDERLCIKTMVMVICCPPAVLTTFVLSPHAPQMREKVLSI